ncbi:hypothetical protein SAMN04488515_3291 [Cognatiyoonia koreensis]|uniref:Uncharacterized protein n=1 Tax=Cognatiyoonia koreensis TaxID=364200 RepID=A0A1I0RUM6_9RHOB|nr:hypothetical protein SAMN04488515_3291 [Cognatiyoonia koreensis]
METSGLFVSETTRRRRRQRWLCWPGEYRSLSAKIHFQQFAPAMRRGILLAAPLRPAEITQFEQNASLVQTQSVVKFQQRKALK